MTQTLSGELADGQRKLLALAVAGANSNAVNPLVTQLSNGPLGGLHDKVLFYYFNCWFLFKQGVDLKREFALDLAYSPIWLKAVY